MSLDLSHIAESFAGPHFVSAIVCPICVGGSRIAHQARNIHPEKPYEFNFRTCLSCRHGWIDPMPSQELLNHLYGKGSLSVIGTEWNDPDLQKMSIPAAFVYERELRDGTDPSTYFELGVGKGSLYSQFLEQGWHCNGVEPGPWGRNFPGVFATIDVVPETIRADVVVALDVLEHVADPISMLSRLRQFAAPRARIYAAMPNRQSLRAAIGRDRWRMLRPLGHVNYWSRESLQKTFSQAGFVVERMKKTDHWERRPFKSLRDVAGAAIEFLGFGDQWIVIARLP